MNTIAKLLAPAALAFAAFGAQAGEIAVGDLGAQKVSLERTAKQPRDTMAQPVRSLYAIGA